MGEWLHPDWLAGSEGGGLGSGRTDSRTTLSHQPSKLAPGASVARNFPGKALGNLILSLQSLSWASPSWRPVTSPSCSPVLFDCKKDLLPELTGALARRRGGSVASRVGFGACSQLACNLEPLVLGLELEGARATAPAR